MNGDKVFISYHSEEYSEASTIRNILTANGISCWMAPESIPFGSNYASEIPKAIEGCEVFLLILSKKSQRSRWVALELDRAMNEGKLIYPLQIEKCDIVDPFNFMLSQTQRYNAYTEKMNAMKRLVQSLRHILGLPMDNPLITTEDPSSEVEPKISRESGFDDADGQKKVFESVGSEQDLVEAEIIGGSVDEFGGDGKTNAEQNQSKTEKADEKADPEAPFVEHPSTPKEPNDSPKDEQPETELKWDDITSLFTDETAPEDTANEPPAETESPQLLSFEIINGTLVKYTGSEKRVRIPDEIEIIGRYAFSGTQAELVIIPSSVSIISSYAFKGAMNLIGVEMEDGVKEIGGHAFEGCRSLEKVVFSNFLEQIRPMAFADCPLREVKLPEGLSKIGSFSFTEAQMEDVVIPSSVSEIEQFAFSSCNRLKYVEIFCSCVPGFAFSSCLSLEKVILHKDIEEVNKDSFSMASSGKVVLAEKNEEISYEAYQNRFIGYSGASGLIPRGEYGLPLPLQAVKDSKTNLSEQEISLSEEEYADKGFLIRDDLLVKYSGNEKEVKIPEGVKRIEENAFRGAFVEKVICPSSLNHISRNAFKDCTSLTSVKLNEGLIFIGFNAFYRCKNLADISFPSTLEYIGEFCFAGTALTEVTVPASVKTIDTDAFSVCFKIKRIDLACEEVGSCAFSCNHYIREIILRENVKRVGRKAFINGSFARVTIMNKDIDLDKKAFHKKAIITYTD